MKIKKLTAVLLSVLMVIAVFSGAALAADTGVCEAGGTKYSSLAEALSNAPDGSTVTLLDNIAMAQNDMAAVPEGKTLTLDMAGKSITVSSDFQGRPIRNDGTLTVTGNGVIDSSASEFGGYGAIDNYGVLTIENGTFRGSVMADGAGLKVRPGAEVTINGGVFEGATCAVYSDGKLTVNDGSFTTTSCNQTTDSRGGKGHWAYCINSRGELYFNNGSVTGVQGGLAISSGYGEVKDGEFKTVGCEHGQNGEYSFYALYIAGEVDAVEAHISGGTYTAAYRVALLAGNDNTGGDGGNNQKATAYITGGSFTGGNGSPAMQAGTNTGDPNITGGSFSSSVKDYVDQSIQFELNSTGVYSYYRTIDEALKNAKDGDTVISVTAPEQGALQATLAYQDGTGTSVALTADENGSITLPSISREGYLLTGWQSGGIQYDVGSVVKLDGNMTFEAQWKRLVSGLALSQQELNLKEKETTGLTVVVSPEDAADQSVSWSSSDPEIATVDENGKVTAMSAGTAVITAVAKDESGKSAECTVTVSHDAMKVEAKAPTATEDGNIEYWYCEACGKYFGDAELTKEIALEDTVLKATGETSKPGPAESENSSSNSSSSTAEDSKAPETGEQNSGILLAGALLLVATAGALCLQFSTHKKIVLNKKGK